MEFQNLHAYTIFIILASCIQPTLSNHPHNSLTDLNALLSFKSLLTDPNRILKDDWTTNSTFCNWLGVTCGRHKRVTGLNLHDLPLQGMISPHLGNLSFLHELDLANTSLVGQIPESIGTIPKELGNLVNLDGLRLENNSLVGFIPITLMNNSQLRFLDISINKLIGHVPIEIGKSLPFLWWFNVAHNQLSGGIKFLSSFSNCKDLIRLQIAVNNLEGRIPEDVANLSSSLSYFIAYSNHIKGNIPSGLGNLTALSTLDLSINELIGNLPTSFSRLPKLALIDLSNNRLSGSIPPEFGAITSMYKLLLANNLFSGSVPGALANMSLLQYLDLSNNNLSSSIPKTLWTLVNLIVLSLSTNTLNGSLPQEVGNLKALTLLDLSVNHISGNIPNALQELSLLLQLNLSKNSFSSEIPEVFGQLYSLTYLNLSYNSLSKSIPKSLANLTNLNVVDLSYNELEGQVPIGKVFANSTISNLLGNKALCGAPQLKPCNTNVGKPNPKRKSRLIILGTILGVILLISLCFVCAYFSYRKPKTLTKSQEPLLEYTRVISRHELVRATNNFSEANLLGRGNFGSVFKGCLDDGLIIAVKVLNLNTEDVPNSFEKECQILRTVRHKNLIKIISVCSNMEFKAIVFEFMPKGNLEQWLYSADCYINMNQRLNIMVEVASALEYLHHHHPHVILHCDLKPTNVLLDEEFVAHVGDFGISKLMYGESRSIITASMPGTIGYIAPEYSSSGTVSKMSDVYSFGILLLETFTKKKPVDDMFDEELSLRDWVCKTHPHAVLDVVDSRLLENNVGNLQSCLLSVIELGLLCSRNSPKERIPMTDVSKRLQKIKTEYLPVS